MGGGEQGRASEGGGGQGRVVDGGEGCGRLGENPRKLNFGMQTLHPLSQ